MTVEELKRIKLSLNMSSAEIAKRSGVPFPTVHKIFCGVTKNPRHSTLTKILDALRSEYLPARYFDHPIPGAPAYLAEDTADYKPGKATKLKDPYPRQGSYTVDDYYALPEDKRVELIDGVIYDMAAPSFDHQTLALQIAHQMIPCEEKHEECRVIISPIDVQLDSDKRTMVQPDVVILCDSSKNRNRCIYGAPDFVLEVLSSSTRKKDTFIKLGKYCSAGCREYWIVDPENQSVTVYDFENDGDVRQYTFDDKVPVTISKGECEIDFAKIKGKLNWGNSNEK